MDEVLVLLSQLLVDLQLIIVDALIHLGEVLEALAHLVGSLSITVSTSHHLLHSLEGLLLRASQILNLGSKVLQYTTL